MTVKHHTQTIENSYLSSLSNLNYQIINFVTFLWAFSPWSCHISTFHSLISTSCQSCYVTTFYPLISTSCRLCYFSTFHSLISTSCRLCYFSRFHYLISTSCWLCYVWTFYSHFFPSCRLLCWNILFSILSQLSVAGIQTHSDMERAHEIAIEMRRLNKHIKECQQLVSLYNGRERIFNMPITSVS